MELLSILQLLSSALNIYNATQGKPGLSQDEKALVDGLPIVIKTAQQLLNKPAYKTAMMQLQLAIDMKEIREAIGAPPPPIPPASQS